MDDYRYPWPASRLTEEEMQILYEQRQKQKKPITQLLKEAVRQTYGGG